MDKSRCAGNGRRAHHWHETIQVKARAHLQVRYQIGARKNCNKEPMKLLRILLRLLTLAPTFGLFCQRWDAREPAGKLCGKGHVKEVAMQRPKTSGTTAYRILELFEIGILLGDRPGGSVCLNVKAIRLQVAKDSQNCETILIDRAVR